MRRILLICSCLLAFPAFAQKLKGDEIRVLFSGNSITGTYVDGGKFSEFHAMDGRALGDSGYSINTDACWNTDGDKVCYHYGKFKERKTYCFFVEKFDEELYLSVADTGRLNAIAAIEPGNPRAHEDAGRRWSCEDLLSGGFKRFTQRMTR